MQSIAASVTSSSQFEQEVTAPSIITTDLEATMATIETMDAEWEVRNVYRNPLYPLLGVNAFLLLSLGAWPTRAVESLSYRRLSVWP